MWCHSTPHLAPCTCSLTSKKTRVTGLVTFVLPSHYIAMKFKGLVVYSVCAKLRVLGNCDLISVGSIKERKRLVGERLGSGPENVLKFQLLRRGRGNIAEPGHLIVEKHVIGPLRSKSSHKIQSLQCSLWSLVQDTRPSPHEGAALCLTLVTAQMQCLPSQFLGRLMSLGLLTKSPHCEILTLPQA
jgi:hypothetical protein